MEEPIALEELDLHLPIYRDSKLKAMLYPSEDSLKKVAPFFAASKGVLTSGNIGGLKSSVFNKNLTYKDWGLGSSWSSSSIKSSIERVYLMLRIPLINSISTRKSFSSYSTRFNELQNIVRKTPKSSRIITSPKLRRSSLNSTQKITKSNSIVDSAIAQNKLKPVTTYTTCENYDFDKLVKQENLRGTMKVLIPNEILHLKFQNEYDVLILESGTIIGWGIDEKSLEEKVLPLFKDSMIGKYDYPESEDMDYISLNEKSQLPVVDESYIVEEVIIIDSRNEDKALLDKAAFSSGLSRSTRLAILENALERHIQKTRRLTEGISKGSKISITERELLRLTGRLFLLRGKLNLYSELIETPDLYWSEPNLEKIYKMVSNILDISPRISILNKKLDYATDESRALMSTLNEKKSTRLEWIIIILITIEVGFESFHFYENYYLDASDNKT
ncbi:hypothetical protein WICMUC_005078 [Wickerhamomyces mucosus]|uniref:DUF155 domain-containing protein n=1 Tax=Wickerhamomyces mucosus TaxID=1378264 RepID=A0A9P8PCU1_9ASCO|nr:hypothetical protein WICMUC_005078 [Wickerhamomyces mucosus]